MTVAFLLLGSASTPHQTADCLRLHAQIWFNTLNLLVFLTHLAVRPYRPTDAEAAASKAISWRDISSWGQSRYRTRCPCHVSRLNVCAFPPMYSAGLDNFLECCSLFALCFLFAPSEYMQGAVAACLLLCAAAFALGEAAAGQQRQVREGFDACRLLRCRCVRFLVLLLPLSWLIELARRCSVQELMPICAARFRAAASERLSQRRAVLMKRVPRAGDSDGDRVGGADGKTRGGSLAEPLLSSE